VTSFVAARQMIAREDGEVASDAPSDRGTGLVWWPTGTCPGPSGRPVYRAEAGPLQALAAAKWVVAVMTVYGLVADGARAVKDYLYGFFVGVLCVADLAEGAEELGSDVGEDSGAFGGDAIANEKKQEPGQEFIDVIGGVEFGELIEKVGGKVVGIPLAFEKTGVTEAEAGAGVQDLELARTARAGALLASLLNRFRQGRGYPISRPRKGRRWLLGRWMG
jgi:hypothetical protein